MGGGISVGDRDKTLFPSNQSHYDDVKALHAAAVLMRSGDGYFKDANYERAAQEYTRAYDMDKGGRAVYGLLLAMTYEKLGRYDDGIALLDEMIARGYLSANGVKNANTIKDRLTAAKSAN